MATLPNPRTWSVGEVVTAALVNAELRDALNFMLQAPYCEVSHNTTQSIANNTAVEVTFNTEWYDTDSMHDTATNNSRITSATTGIYLVTAQVAFAPNTTGTRELWLRRSDGTVYGRQSFNPANNNNGFLSTAWHVPLTAGQYVETFAFQNSGGALNISNALGGGTRMSARWVRKA